MFKNIFEYNTTLDHYFHSKKINNSTILYFNDHIKYTSTNNNNILPVFKYYNTRSEIFQYIPVNYLNLYTFNEDLSSSIIFIKNPTAIYTYIFDSPFEMLYYYQLNSKVINENHQFICFFNTVTKETLKHITAVSKDTKLNIVFSTQNQYQFINALRLSLVLLKKEFHLSQEKGCLVLKMDKDTYRLENSKLGLYEAERMLKTRSNIKTIKPPKSFNSFKEIIFES